MKVVASIQVRMGSGRFPGKVMKEVREGRPLLGYLLDRLRLSSVLDQIVVATSTRAENDVIEEFCHSESIPCFRGSEDDVLERTVEALMSQKADIGVEVFGDCPLIDPAIVNNMVTYFLENPGYDFVGNDLRTTYPPGMEVEVFLLDALKDSHQRVSDPLIREHGTLFIRQNPDIYNLINLDAPSDLSRPEMELEVDTVEDFQVIKAVIEHFSTRKDYSLSEIIQFMDSDKTLARINQGIPRRWREARYE
jgi:spore coat polysaccharide biosynthesis protein SpsF